MVLEDSGVDPRRFAIEWVSSAEAPRFAEVVTRFTETVRDLGPLRGDVSLSGDVREAA